MGATLAIALQTAMEAQMSGILKVELWKSKHNRFFILALIIGIAVALYHTAETIPMVQEAWYYNLEMQQTLGIPGFGNLDSCSLFLYWMPFTGYTYGSFLFYEIWPLLAAMPYAWSYSHECYNGYYLQTVSRVNKIKWFHAKYLALFISGGIVTAIPLIVSLLAQATFSPAIPMEYTMMQVIGISNAEFLSSLYYTHPWIYCICWCGVQFLFGGTAAVTVFLFGSRLRFIPLAILLPYGLFYCLAALGTAFDTFANVTFEVNILHMAMAAPLSHNPGWLIFSFIGILMCISYLTGFFRVVNHDLL